jgi:hypothetical protein
VKALEGPSEKLLIVVIVHSQGDELVYLGIVEFYMGFDLPFFRKESMSLRACYGDIF